MRLRTFTAPDMPTAMKMVRDALGDEAVIVASETHPSRKSISVTAAIDVDDDRTTTAKFTSGIEALTARTADKKKEVEAKAAADDVRFEMQNILRFHNVPDLYIAKIVHKASDIDLQALIGLHRIGGRSQSENLEKLALEKILGNYFAFEPMQYETSHRKLMLVGAPGIGKTLTIAKIAAKLSMDRHPVTVFTTDNKRAGGIEQLKAFTDILNVPLHVCNSREELTQHLGSMPKNMHGLIDSAGCNPYDSNELAELKSLASLDGVKPILVMAAGSDSLEAIDMAEAFTSMLPITRLLITRADTARRFGGVIAAAAAHSLALCNASSSGSIIEPLHPLSPSLLAEWLLRYKTPARGDSALRSTLNH